jgi:hypothetical protein
LSFEVRRQAALISWLIWLLVGSAAYFLFIVVLGLRDHRQRQREMNEVDEIMGRKEKRKRSLKAALTCLEAPTRARYFVNR